MRLQIPMMFCLTAAMVVANVASASDPSDTVRMSEQVLGELMAIPARQIPRRLLDEAQAVVIVPNVVKIGFIAGARRGHGVLLVRDVDGEWSLPQFLTLTGGSVGWQAGVQGTDVVLVFTTRNGVDQLLRGNFTIGVDAAVAAGPVGRDMTAGTDAELRSEVYSYSRSRGLFVGVAIDGSALEIDHEAHAFYYGSPTSMVPRRVPEPASQLQKFLVELAPGKGHVSTKPLNERPVNEHPNETKPSRRVEFVRRSLIEHSNQLQAILSPEWQKFLALPREVYDPQLGPGVEAVAAMQRRYARLAESGEYPQLVQRQEFQSTYEALTEYHALLAPPRTMLQLPPPPPNH